MNLTGRYYLRRRFFGGYNVYVEFSNSSGGDNFWRKGEPHHVAQVLTTKIL